MRGELGDRVRLHHIYEAVLELESYLINKTNISKDLFKKIFHPVEEIFVFFGFRFKVL